MREIDATIQAIVQSRCGGRVERCHGVPHHGSYSNAAHSWGVAMLMHYIWPEDFPRLALICLSHDAPEGWVGDIPSPVMIYVPGLGGSLKSIEASLNRSMGLPGEDELSPDDHAKLKACDRLELYLWCREQAMMGNKFSGEFQGELELYFESNPMPSRAQAIYERLRFNSMLPRQTGVIKEMME